jgi:Uma2 family endonuclease
MIQLTLPELMPGSFLRLACSWTDYQRMAQARGDSSIPRLKYRNGELLIMVPLPEHGKNAHLIARAAEVLLEQERRRYEAFTPVTMTIPQVGGIEPDYCFYLDPANLSAVRGKTRIDWQNDPPPDLVIEIDVTSYSAPEDYLPYRVPELWLYREQLQIYRLESEHYGLAGESRYFPGHNLKSTVATMLRIAYEQDTSSAIWWLRDSLGSASQT